MSKSGKIVTIILWVLLIISTVLVVSLMVNISDNDADPVMGGWINSNLIWTYILVVFVAGVALISGLMHMVTDKKAAKRGVITIILFAIVAGISYMFASDSIPQFVGVDKFINDGTLTAQVSKMIDTGLYATYILIGVAILSVAFSSVTRLFK